MFGKKKTITEGITFVCYACKHIVQKPPFKIVAQKSDYRDFGEIKYCKGCAPKYDFITYEDVYSGYSSTPDVRTRYWVNRKPQEVTIDGEPVYPFMSI